MRLNRNPFRRPLKTSKTTVTRKRISIQLSELNDITFIPPLDIAKFYSR